MLLQPMSQTDVFYSVDVFFCLPTFTFQLLYFLVLPNYKTQRPSRAEQSSQYFYFVITFWSFQPPICCVCVCLFCVCVICDSHSVSHCYLGKQCFWFDCNSKQTLYSSKTICHFSILMTIVLSLVQRSEIGFHHI